MLLPQLPQIIKIYCLLVYVQLGLCSDTSPPPRIHHRLRRVNLERHRSSRFSFATLNTRITTSYAKFPTLPDNPSTLLPQLTGRIPCSISLSVTLIKFRKKGSRTICLFKVPPSCIQQYNIFHQGSVITLGGSRFSPAQLYTQTQLVKGFVVGHHGSSIHGHISSSNEFYGWVKLIDKKRGHHIAFYVEPLVNTPLYNIDLLNSPIARMEGDNAIIFETVIQQRSFQPKKPNTNKVYSRETSTQDGIFHSTEVTIMEISQTIETNTTNVNSDLLIHSTDVTNSKFEFSVTTTRPYHSTEKVQMSTRVFTQTPSIASTKEDGDTRTNTPSPESDGDSDYEHFQSSASNVTSGVDEVTESGATDSEDDYETFNAPVSIISGLYASSFSPAYTPLHSSEFITPGFHTSSLSSKEHDLSNPTNPSTHGTPTTDDSVTSTIVSGTVGLSASPITSTTKKKRYPILHSTKAVPRDKTKTNNSRMKRDLHHLDPKDITKPIDLTSEDWPGAEDVFNLETLTSFPICSLCIWIQPNFAELFGLCILVTPFFGHNSGLLHGGSEVIQIIRLADWLLRSQDINGDGSSDNIGLKIRSLSINDEIRLTPTLKEKEYAEAGPLYPLMLNMNRRRRKKRSLDSAAFDPSNYDQNLAFETLDQDYPTNILGNPNEAVKIDAPIPHLLPYPPLEVQAQVSFTKMIYSLSAEDAYARLAPQIRAQHGMEGCCARLAFIYHNLSSSLSISSKNGGCNPSNNIAIISGLYGSSKVGAWDLVREVLRSLGHLFGADHESLQSKDNQKCGSLFQEEEIRERAFINPPLMNFNPHLNVGLRPASYRFSACAKRRMQLFLTSGNAKCLTKEDNQDSFCGNGWVEADEICDCGSPSACMDTANHCGASDSVFSCNRMDYYVSMG